MAVEVLLRPKAAKLLRRRLSKSTMLRIAKKLLNGLGCVRPVELSILLTDDREISALNRKFRKKSRPTDVLSFPMGASPGPAAVRMLGDVVISVERAEEQAGALGIRLEEEMLRLLIHGVLHLCGYDHERVSKRRAAEMKRKENELYDAVYGLL